MKRYIAKRLVHGFIAIYVLITSIFVFIRAIPGDTARNIAGFDASPQVLESIRTELGLSEPLHIQYITYLQNLATGDFGDSMFTGRPVVQELLSSAEPTVSIAVVGMGIALLLAIPSGILAAVRQYRMEDHAATVLSFVAISLPGFFVAILFLLLFSLELRLFPSFGYVSPRESILAWFQHIWLPALSIGIPIGGILMRMVRSSVLEVLNKEYIVNARAKGLDPRIVLFKHALQNALIPVVTFAALLLGSVLGGVVAIETVFGIRGLGRLLIRAILNLDFMVVQGAVIVIGALFVFINIAVDILYTAINPKIRYGGGEGR